MKKTDILDRCARTPEERLLLARALDKLEAARNRGVPSHTSFLSPGEAASVTDMLNACGRPPCFFWGGFPDAERTVCVFLPDWETREDFLASPDLPVSAVEGHFPRGAEPGHRDILGSLMGLGLTREKLGDILLPAPGLCQVAVLRETLPVLLSQWESAGRWKVSAEEIPLSRLSPRPPELRIIRSTVSALRLDAVLAAGFSLSRSRASALIAAGKAAVNHRECMKGDRQLEQGDVITCRGLGKFVLQETGGLSRRGRINVTLARYI